MLPIVVTMGEPAGIAGEITLKAWLGRGDGVPAFYLIDDPARIGALARHLGWPVPVRPISAPHEALAVFDEALPIAPIDGTLRASPAMLLLRSTQAWSRSGSVTRFFARIISSISLSRFL